jgi:FkbM family methyltransferase
VQVRVRTPLGIQTPTVYSHGDVCTVTEIFCRHDYRAGSEAEVVVDIGSNIGLSALYFLTRTPRSRCYLYEPVPSNVARLRANLAAFTDRWTLNEVAVADREGRLSFGVESTGRYGGLQAFQHQDFLSRWNQASFTEVQCVHINAVLAEVLAREGRIDLLKIDTEGAELDTVAAIDPDYRRRIGVIYVEASGYSTTLRLKPETQVMDVLPLLTPRT